MRLETRPWIADFRIDAALDSFPFLLGFEVYIFLIGLFLVFSAFQGSGFGVVSC